MVRRQATMSKTSLPKVSMAENEGPIYQQIGHLQGQMTSILSAQQSGVRQIAEMGTSLRIELERMNTGVEEKFKKLEARHEENDKRHNKVDLKIARLQWEQALYSAGISIGVSIATAVAIHFLTR